MIWRKEWGVNEGRKKEWGDVEKDLVGMLRKKEWGDNMKEWGDNKREKGVIEMLSKKIWGGVRERERKSVEMSRKKE